MAADTCATTEDQPCARVQLAHGGFEGCLGSAWQSPRWMMSPPLAAALNEMEAGIHSVPFSCTSSGLTLRPVAKCMCPEAYWVGLPPFPGGPSGVTASPRHCGAASVAHCSTHVALAPQLEKQVPLRQLYIVTWERQDRHCITYRSTQYQWSDAARRRTGN